MRQLTYQLRYTRCQVLFYLWWIGPVLKHCKCSKILWPGLYVVSNQLVGYVSFSLILASVEVVHSCSAKQMYRKILKTLPSLCCCHFVTSCRPKSCNCVKIETPAQVFFSNFCEFSQNSLLQINREELLLIIEWWYGKIYSRNESFIESVSVCSVTEIVWEIFFKNFPKPLFEGTEKAK